MNAKHPPQRRGRDGGTLDLWARTRAAGDHPDPWDQPSEPVAVTVVQPCTCGGGPRPRSRLAATWRALLGWIPTYLFDPACPAHQQLGDLPAYRHTHPPIVFAERVPAWTPGATRPACVAATAGRLPGGATTTGPAARSRSPWPGAGRSG